jgi:hypothetical protein
MPVQGVLPIKKLKDGQDPTTTTTTTTIIIIIIPGSNMALALAALWEHNVSAVCSSFPWHSRLKA